MEYSTPTPSIRYINKTPKSARRVTVTGAVQRNFSVATYALGYSLNDFGVDRVLFVAFG